jgi:hypothetical protein
VFVYLISRGVGERKRQLKSILKTSSSIIARTT